MKIIKSIRALCICLYNNFTGPVRWSFVKKDLQKNRPWILHFASFYVVVVWFHRVGAKMQKESCEKIWSLYYLNIPVFRCSVSCTIFLACIHCYYTAFLQFHIFLINLIRNSYCTHRYLVYNGIKDETYFIKRREETRDDVKNWEKSVEGVL